MQVDYNSNGMSDFMCTNTVQYLQRDGVIHVVVQMRSNDSWAGYRNDRAWQDYILSMLADETGYRKGSIYWNAGSLHIYSRQFYLIDHCAKTGEISIPKKKYIELYPNSQYI
jgi:thymidylate synthase